MNSADEKRLIELITRSDKKWTEEEAAFVAKVLGSDRLTATVMALSQMEKDSDRAVGIVGAALVEEELSLCIERHLVRTTSDHRDRIKNLMRPSGAMGAFSTKIDLGWLMGIYGKDVWSELAALKDVRNSFAHKLEMKNFDHSAIAAICRKLKLAEKYLQKTERGFLLVFQGPTGMNATHEFPAEPHPLSTPRRRFTASCYFLTLALKSNYPEGRTHAPFF